MFKIDFLGLIFMLELLLVKRNQISHAFDRRPDKKIKYMVFSDKKWDSPSLGFFSTYLYNVHCNVLHLEYMCGAYCRNEVRKMYEI